MYYSPASSYREVLVSPAGERHTDAGIFTGVLERLPQGWRLRDAHWSSAPRGAP